MKKGILYILIGVALCGCFKDEEYDTTLVLRPMMQMESDGDFTTYPDCVAYAFNADSTEWMVASWADACSGVLTSKTDGSTTKAAYATAQSYSADNMEEGSMLSMRVALSSVMIVVANTITENYGYTQYSVGLNLATTYLYARFRPWKEGIYTESSWVYSAPEAVEETETETETEETETETETETEEEVTETETEETETEEEVTETETEETETEEEEEIETETEEQQE